MLFICRLDTRCTNAIIPLLITPLVAGDTTPITNINIEKNRPNLCFRNVTNAIRAAHVCTNTDDTKPHRNMWYHISTNVFNPCVRKFKISAKVSSFDNSSFSILLLLLLLLSQAIQLQGCISSFAFTNCNLCSSEFIGFFGIQQQWMHIHLPSTKKNQKMFSQFAFIKKIM